MQSEASSRNASRTLPWAIPPEKHGKGIIQRGLASKKNFTLFSKDLEIYICGGGAHNRFLMKNLKANFKTISVKTTSNLGIEPDWVEAAAFAWMAKQTIQGIKLETIPFTGARKSCILGGIYHGS